MNDQPPPASPAAAWWSNVAANAVGSAIGTGLVALVLAGLGIATGILKTDGGLQRLSLGVIGALIVLSGISAGIVLIRAGRRRPADQRSEWYTAATLSVVMMVAVSSIFFLASVNFDPHLCEKHPVACQGGEG